MTTHQKTKQHLYLSILTALTLSAFAFPFSSVGALEDISTVTIRYDGTIEPASAPITHQGNTYTLTADLTNSSLIIQKNDLTFDGANYTINGEIKLYGNHLTIKNTQINSAGLGILVNGNYSVIEQNYFLHNLADISANGDYATIRENTVFWGAYCAFYIGGNYSNVTGNYLRGIEVSGSNNLIADNTLDYLSKAGENNTYRNNTLNAYKTVTSTPVLEHATPQPTEITVTNSPQPAINDVTADVFAGIVIALIGVSITTALYLRTKKHRKPTI